MSFIRYKLICLFAILETKYGKNVLLMIADDAGLEVFNALPKIMYISLCYAVDRSPW